MGKASMWDRNGQSNLRKHSFKYLAQLVLYSQHPILPHYLSIDQYESHCLISAPISLQPDLQTIKSISDY